MYNSMYLTLSLSGYKPLVLCSDSTAITVVCIPCNMKCFFIFYRYILNKKSDEDDPNIDRWLEWESVQLQVMTSH